MIPSIQGLYLNELTAMVEWIVSQRGGTRPAAADSILLAARQGNWPLVLLRSDIAAREDACWVQVFGKIGVHTREIIEKLKEEAKQLAFRGEGEPELFRLTMRAREISTAIFLLIRSWPRLRELYQEAVNVATYVSDMAMLGGFHNRLRALSIYAGNTERKIMSVIEHAVDRHFDEGGTKSEQLARILSVAESVANEIHLGNHSAAKTQIEEIRLLRTPENTPPVDHSPEWSQVIYMIGLLENCNVSK